jgi:hypothetical protein
MRTFCEESMERRPDHDQQMLEAMESCRPGSDDPQDPALAGLAAAMAIYADFRGRFERQQRADLAMRAALGDVSLPEGLSRRLLERLAAAQAEKSPLSRVAEQVAPPAGKAASGWGPRRFSRRWLAVAAAALAAAAVLLATAWLWTHRSDAYTSVAAVEEEATYFFQSESPAPSHQLGEVSPPADYPLSREVVRTLQVRWRPIQGFLGRAGVAYDLAAPAGPAGPAALRATLYVVSRVIPGLRATVPPPEPRRSTAGCSTAVWQEGDLLYVLVVEGGPGVYRGYLRSPSGPLT